MPKIDIQKLKASVEDHHDPFEFYLYIVLSKEGKLEDCPYSKDKTFLNQLLDHYESVEEYEMCCDLRLRLQQLN